MARRWPRDEAWQLAERLADPHRYVLVYQQLHGLGIRTAPRPVRAGWTGDRGHRAAVTVVAGSGVESVILLVTA
jgi:hypothetical protein